MLFKRIFTALWFVLVLLVPGCSDIKNEFISFEEKQTLTVGGTGTNLPLMKKLADVYMEKNQNVTVEIPACLDSEGTIKNTLEGNLDIGLLGHAINQNQDIVQVGLRETVYAKTLVVFAVNPSVPVSDLTIKQVKNIFSGQISNWKAVGGPDREIMVIIGDRDSCTKLAIDKSISGFSSLEIPPGFINVGDCQAINEGIASVQDSIGYTDIGLIKTDDLKIKTISLDGKIPTPDNYRLGEYPLIKQLTFLTEGEPQGVARDFIDYVTGWEGKKVIMENGYMVD